jgi:hypothetical protein
MLVGKLVEMVKICMKDFHRCRRLLLLFRRKSSLQRRHYLNHKLNGPTSLVKSRDTAKNFYLSWRLEVSNSSKSIKGNLLRLLNKLSKESSSMMLFSKTMLKNSLLKGQTCNSLVSLTNNSNSNLHF